MTTPVGLGVPVPKLLREFLIRQPRLHTERFTSHYRDMDRSVRSISDDPLWARAPRPPSTPTFHRR
jgi:hypothetical protein